MRTIACSALVTAAVVALASPAEAQVVIKQPNAHPDYSVELEPHGTFVFFHRYYGYGGGRGFRGNRGFYAFSDPELGAGFRATIPIVDPGFIPKLNNTVGITFGIDVTNCQFCGRGYGFSIYTPVGIQWNFFITRKFSAFADIGFILATEGFYHNVYPDFMGMLGGRYHFNDDIAFTFRIGYPFINVGVSFFI
jgi:hypothetical protein